MRNPRVSEHPGAWPREAHSARHAREITPLLTRYPRASTRSCAAWRSVSANQVRSPPAGAPRRAGALAAMRLQREVVAHHVALQRATLAAHILRPALGIAAGDGEAELVAPRRWRGRSASPCAPASRCCAHSRKCTKLCLVERTRPRRPCGSRWSRAARSAQRAPRASARAHRPRCARSSASAPSYRRRRSSSARRALPAGSPRAARSRARSGAGRAARTAPPACAAPGRPRRRRRGSSA